MTFWVSKSAATRRSARQAVFDYEPQRDLQLALTEYAPGRSLTIDKWRFESAALYSPYEPTPAPTLARRQPYTACRSARSSAGRRVASGDTVPVLLRDDIDAHVVLTPAGFAPDINEKREVDRGEPIIYAGITGPRASSRLQDIALTWDGTAVRRPACCVWTGPQTLAMVNKGVEDAVPSLS